MQDGLWAFAGFAPNPASDHYATELAEIAWLAHRLPEPEGTHIQELARSYAEVVVEEEWALMREGRASPHAWAILDEIQLEIENMEVRTDAEWALYLQALQGVYNLNDARRDGLVDAEEGLPALLWIVLLLGGVIVVGFTYLFGLDNTLVHTLMARRWRRLSPCRCSPSVLSITRSGGACRSVPRPSS